MKIEVGGVYLARNGERVEILHDKASNGKWPYRGDNSLTYTKSGSHRVNGSLGEHDLISLWDEKPKPANIIAEINELAQRHGLTITVYHDTAYDLQLEFRK